MIEKVLLKQEVLRVFFIKNFLSQRISCRKGKLLSRVSGPIGVPQFDVFKLNSWRNGGKGM